MALATPARGATRGRPAAGGASDGRGAQQSPHPILTGYQLDLVIPNVADSDDRIPVFVVVGLAGCGQQQLCRTLTAVAADQATWHNLT